MQKSGQRFSILVARTLSFNTSIAIPIVSQSNTVTMGVEFHVFLATGVVVSTKEMNDLYASECKESVESEDYTAWNCYSQGLYGLSDPSRRGGAYYAFHLGHIAHPERDIFVLDGTLKTLVDRKIGMEDNGWSGFRRPGNGFAILTNESAFAADNEGGEIEEDVKEKLVDQIRTTNMPDKIKDHIVEHGQFGDWPLCVLLLTTIEIDQYNSYSSMNSTVMSHTKCDDPKDKALREVANYMPSAQDLVCQLLRVKRPLWSKSKVKELQELVNYFADHIDFDAIGMSHCRTGGRR